MRRVLVFVLSMWAGAALSAPTCLIFSGDFETGNFRQWNSVRGFPQYCRPPNHGVNPRPPEDPGNGDGSCLSLETNIVRQGQYAARMTIKNSANGSEVNQRDCDGPVCTRRRSELWTNRFDFDGRGGSPDGMPHLSERWISHSVYIPNNYNVTSASRPPLIFQLKEYTNWQPVITIEPWSDGWSLYHAWSDQEGADPNNVAQHQKMIYRRDVIASHPGLKVDFPDEATSMKYINRINRGGWTDFVMNIRFDSRTAPNGGTGFIKIWMREDDGPWDLVWHIVPRQITYRNQTFQRGIMMRDRHWIVGQGMYSGKASVWNAPNNTTIIFDNLQIACERATFEQMVPEGGSTPEQFPAPTQLAISGRRLSWQHPGAEGFVISSPGGRSASVPGSERSIPLSRIQLASGATQIEVRAVSGAQSSSATIPLTVGTSPQPSQVCAVAGSPNQVTWQYTAGTDTLLGFDILLDGTLIGQTGAAARSLDVGAFPAGSRTVTVRARTTQRAQQVRSVTWTAPAVGAQCG